MTKLKPNEAAERTANGDELMLSGNEPQCVQVPVAWRWKYRHVEPDKWHYRESLEDAQPWAEPLYTDLAITQAEIMATGDTVTTLRSEEAKPGKCLRLEHGIACDELAAAVSERDAARFELAQRSSEGMVDALKAAKEFADDEFSRCNDLPRKHRISVLCDKIDAALAGAGARAPESTTLNTREPS